LKHGNSCLCPHPGEEAGLGMTQGRRLPTAGCMIECYELLGLSRDASLSEVKKAYHHLAKAHHPDVVSTCRRIQAEIEFKKISQAYQLIINAPASVRMAHANGAMDVTPGYRGIGTQSRAKHRAVLSPGRIALLFAVPVMATAASITWSYLENQHAVQMLTGRREGLLNPATNEWLAEKYHPRTRTQSESTATRMFNNYVARIGKMCRS